MIIVIHSTTNEQTNKNYWGSSSIKKPKIHLELHKHISFSENTVECITLDSFVKQQNIDTIHVIHCVVNGAEKEIIEGGYNTLIEKMV